MFDEEKRASWFSHKAENAHPYYYNVYLADYDVLTEITPTERSAVFQLTYPKSDSSFILVDAFDRGSYIKIIPEENKIIGYTTRNRGGVPDNFKNYFVIESDKPFSCYFTGSDSLVSAVKKEINRLSCTGCCWFFNLKRRAGSFAGSFFLYIIGAG